MRWWIPWFRSGRGRTGWNAKSSISLESASRVTPTCGAFCFRTIGKGIRCAEIIPSRAIATCRAREKCSGKQHAMTTVDTAIGATKTMVLNMGPQHPSTHGVLRILLELDGETVVKAVPDLGYLHTGIE